MLYTKMESVISKENDYKQRLLSTPSYEMYPVYQQTGGTSITLPVGGGSVITFELPTSVFNLAESILRFTMTPPAAAAYNKIFTGFPFRQITLTDSSGFELANIPDVFKYFHAVSRHDIPDQQFNSNVLAGGTVPFEGIAKMTDEEYDGDTALRYAGGLIAEKNEPIYMFNGGSATATPVITYMFDMKLLVDTIFAMDKDLYFGKAIYLRLYSLPVNQMGYSGVENGTGNTALVGAIPITNLEFDLAQQKNENLKNQAMAMFQNTELYIPFVLTDRYTTSVSQSQTVTKKYIPSDGKFLKRIVVVPYHLTDNGNTTLDRNNLGSIKVVSYQTRVNGQNTTQNILTCANYDDYILFKNRIKGSMINRSDEYYFNWRHEEIFSDDGAIRDKLNPSSNLIGGLPISKEFNYDVKATTANLGLNWYFFSVVYRKLMFNNGVLSYEN